MDASASGGASPRAEPERPQAAPLDELMLAMDVVDTLRHRELMLDRELEADDRDERLLARLRQIYGAQGIDVSDAVLAQGVRALRENRFVYAGPSPSLSRVLGRVYVSRDRWGKWVGGAGVVLVAAALAFQLLVRGPALRAGAELPGVVAAAYREIVVSTRDTKALGEAGNLHAAAEAALAEHDYSAARTAVAGLRSLEARLERRYELRIVSRPGERSGVWRVPGDNSRARNFYLIVEAVAPNGGVLALPIRSEEDGRTRVVRKWGLRVDESTYDRVAADKRDDGIIEQAVVGTKRRGELDPHYSIATTGAAITSW